MLSSGTRQSRENIARRRYTTASKAVSLFFIAVSPSLEDLITGEFARKAVAQDNQDEAHGRFCQVHGRGHAIFQIHKTQTIYVGINDIARRINELRVHIKYLVEAAVKDASQGKRRHQNNGRNDAGQCQIADFLHAGRTIDVRRLVHVLTDTGHGGEINDRAIAEVFPRVRGNQQRAEGGGLDHPNLGVHAEQGEHLVEHAGEREEIREDYAQNDPGQEVGQIADRLNGALDFGIGAFVEQRAAKKTGTTMPAMILNTAMVAVLPTA